MKEPKPKFTIITDPSVDMFFREMERAHAPKIPSSAPLRLTSRARKTRPSRKRGPSR